MSCGAPCDPEGRRVDRVALLNVPWPGDWTRDAACRGMGPDVFFATEAAEGQEVCLGCPVRVPCREYAERYRLAWGTWGGVTEKERRARRRRKSVEAARAGRVA